MYATGTRPCGRRPALAGAKPRFSDSEVMTLLLLMDFLPFPGETQFLGFVRANHRALFPRLLSQSQFNRRARNLWPRVEALRRHWAEALGATRASLYLLDTKPLPVVGYKRRKDRSDFAATADYGVCASRHLKSATSWSCSAPRRGCPQPTTWYRPRRTSGWRGSRSWTGCGGPASSATRALTGSRALEILTPARRNQRPARPADVQRWLNRH